MHMTGLARSQAPAASGSRLKTASVPEERPTQTESQWYWMQLMWAGKVARPISIPRSGSDAEYNRILERRRKQNHFELRIFIPMVAQVCV